MNNEMITDDEITIQWVDRKDDKYIVKFESIEVPVEMNSGYYNSMIKPLYN